MNRKQLERDQKKINVLKGYKEARSNVNIFSALVMKDQRTGNAFKQAEHHRIFQEHIDQCQREGRYAGILAPWGSG